MNSHCHWYFSLSLVFDTIVFISPLKPVARQAEALERAINGIELGLFDELCMNIAGNGIYRLSPTLSQGQCNDFTTRMLEAVISHPGLKHPIKHIRTGGQTGFDEAGAIAVLRLGVPTTVLLPLGYKMRGENGADLTMTYEQAKSRFI